jgi:hypothetical protein
MRQFRIVTMINQAAPSILDPSVTAETQEDARDLLARLYREIGISAVAAALCVTIAKDHDTGADKSAQASSDQSGMAA